MLFPLLGRLFIAFATGFTLQFISPPTYLHYIHWFTYVPLLLVLDHHSNKKNFWLGYLCGVVGIFFLFYWLSDTLVLFSNLPKILTLILLLAFSLILGIPYGICFALVIPLKKHFPKSWIFILPAFWVSLELLTPNVFPYYQGVSQYRILWIWQLATVFGAYGLTYLIILSNCTLADVIEQFLPLRINSPHPPLNLRGGDRGSYVVTYGIVLCLFIATFIYGILRFNYVEKALSKAPTIKVGLIQRHEKMEERFDYSYKETINLLNEESKKISQEKMDLLVWPENADLLNPKKYQDLLVELLQPSGAFLLSGSPERKGKTKWNASYFINSQGKIIDRYHKMILLPFGEYIPKPFTFLKKYIEGPNDLTAGEKVTYFQLGPFSFSTPICYEAIIEKQLRKMTKGDFLLNITDDGWFGDSQAPYQHAMLAATSATKFGLPLIREAFNGVNMVVEPHGVISYETTPFMDKAEVVTLRIKKFKTPYQSWGRFSPYLCLIIAGIALLKVKFFVT